MHQQSADLMRHCIANHYQEYNRYGRYNHLSRADESDARTVQGMEAGTGS